MRLGGHHNMPPPVTLTFDLLTLKSVWESHVTWGTPVQSFVFLGLLVFELEPVYATSDRRTTDADHRLMPPGGGIISAIYWLEEVTVDTAVTTVRNACYRILGIYITISEHFVSISQYFRLFSPRNALHKTRNIHSTVHGVKNIQSVMHVLFLL